MRYLTVLVALGIVVALSTDASATQKKTRTESLRTMEIYIPGEIQLIEQILTHPNKSVKSFWEWFARNENVLFKAKSDTEPTIKELSEILRSIDPALKIQIGWTRQGIADWPAERHPTDLNTPYQTHILYDELPGMRRLVLISCKNCTRDSAFMTQLLVAGANLPGYRKQHAQLQFVQLGEKWLIAVGAHPPTSSTNPATPSANHAVVTGELKLQPETWRSCRYWINQRAAISARRRADGELVGENHPGILKEFVNYPP